MLYLQIGASGSIGAAAIDFSNYSICAGVLFECGTFSSLVLGLEVAKIEFQ